MAIHKLDIYRVRNIYQASLLPSPTLNFIYGNNGSGKSSLLEAIYLLGRASSFRTNQINNVISENTDDLIVSGQIHHANQFRDQLGVLISSKKCEIHINQNANCKRSELVSALPIQIIHPKSYQMLDGGSTLRREFIDWGVFNQDKEFLLIWRRYKKCLHHRNALLKSKSTRHLTIWNKELANYAHLINKLRASYISDFESVFDSISQFFLEYKKIHLHFSSGWDTNYDLEFIYQESLERDLKYGFTYYGPHRSDIDFKINGNSVKDFASRGQLKLITLSLKLAQIRLMSLKSSKICTLLIDDLSAELDLVNRTKLLQFLFDSGCQVFITATEPTEFGDIDFFNNSALFHVEQGRIKQV